MYKENSEFLGKEEVFRKFIIREERGKKKIRRKGKMLFY
jgi:hypothetical protein